MSVVYGYARVSTPSQSMERQVRNITAYDADARICREAYSGRRVVARPEYARLMGKVKSGDTIVFDSVSRMSRNADEGVKEYLRLFGMGVDLVFLKERYVDTEVYRDALGRSPAIVDMDTGDAGTDRLLSSISEALADYARYLAERQVRIAFEQAQKEVDDLRQRTREGMETARMEGRQIGGRVGSKYRVKKASKAKEVIRRCSRRFGGTLSNAETWRLAGISETTFYRYCRQIEEEVGSE